MSRAWDGADSLVGLMGTVSIANGKQSAGGRNGFYGQSPGMMPLNTNGSPGGLPPGLEFHDGGVYMAQQYAAAGAAAGILPAAYHNGYQTQGFHPATAYSPQGLPQNQGYPQNGGGQDMNGGAANGGGGGQVYIPGAIGMEGFIVPNMGWGGQAIQDAGGFKAPWFGRSRGRGNGNGHSNANNGGHGNGHNNNGNNHSGNGNSRGRNRGRNNGHNGGGHGGGRNNRTRRAWGEGGGLDDHSGDDISVDTLVALVAATPEGVPLGDNTYKALFQLEGRSCALLLKELARVSMQRRAGELFDWVRALADGHPLQCLLDVYSYTAAISLCIATQEVERALALANEMKARGIERNVHTYTALMNVCIKCSKHAMALETYKLMLADGCVPNVVTYNTLIDVHGKMGAWEDAVAVLGIMKAEGVEPVLRTYNTLLIACNMCSQPREAVAVYRRMLEEGFAPNSTTYNALISAYGKAGQLERVMEVFHEMMYRGCERNVITYSSLISACEKAGQWELALELFQEMVCENCQPNTVTFNSLITALGQGAQWEKAQEVFEQMQAQGCRPDVVTYTALISSLEKGGQWRLAVAAFERMRRQGCRADSIVYNAVIDTLWETGVVWAQRRALGLFRTAVEEGHFGQGRLSPGLGRAEVNLHAMTAGVAMLCLYAWLVSLKQLVVAHGTDAAPTRVAIVTDRGRGSKEQGNLVVKEAVAALMAHWGAPFKAANDGALSGVLEASGGEIAAWLLSTEFETELFAFFPCTDVVPSMANSGQTAAAASAVGSLMDDIGNQKEISVELRCSEAFAAVRHFEKTHCLALQNMGFGYLQRRSELVARCADVTAALGVKSEAAHDAVLLMDRVMSTSLNLAPDLLDLLAASCVVIAAKQVDGPASNFTLPAESDLQAAAGLPTAAVEQMEWNVRQVLGQDTAAISTLRCLKLYLERLGAHQMDEAAALAMAGRSFDLVTDCLTDMSFLNCRPSVIAAAVLYTDRRARGVIPFWPTMLAKLTGYQDMSTPELSVAIKAAQRVCRRSTTSGAQGPLPPSASANSLSHAGSSQLLARASSASSLASSNPASSSVNSVATSSSSTMSGSGGRNGNGLSAHPIGLSPADQAVLLALQKGAAPEMAGLLTPASMIPALPVSRDGSSSSSGQSSGRSSANEDLVSVMGLSGGGCASAAFLFRQE